MNTNTLLTMIWWTWGVALIVLLVVISNLPLFGEDVRAAWEWFVPNLFPVMALVGGIQYEKARGRAREEAKPAQKSDTTKVSEEDASAPPAAGARPQSWVAVTLSLLYLALLSGALLGTLWSPSPLESLRMANLWLGPVLALNTAALGVLFARS